jgi:hypothetical protein
VRRREFIAALAGAAGWPFSTRAQQQTLPLIGLLKTPSPGPLDNYGLRPNKRVGSIAGGSNVLQLTETSTFKVGDQVIVEVGGERGKGQFGSMGVGGILSAATDGWRQFYYRSKDLPLALVSKITGVADSGRTLTLDKAAATTATNANVHFDNHPLLKKVLTEEHPAGWTVTLPAGDFAISDTLQHRHYGGWTISGAGKGVTILRSPKGAPGGGLRCFETNDTQIRDLTIIGNAGQNGFGLTDHVTWVDYGVGILIAKSSNCVIRNVSCVDVFRKAAWGEHTSNLQVYDCDLIMNDPFRGYLEWWFGVSDSSNSTFTRCRINSKYLIPGFETFRSDGVKFIDCISKNGVFSSNSSGNFLLDGFTLVVTAGSQFDKKSFSHLNPAVNINSNIQPPNAAMPMGGTIKKVNIIVQGPIDALGNLLKGIVINDQNSNITVTGGIITYPNATPGAEVGPFGVNSTGTNTAIRNLTVTGKPANSWEVNIYVRNGIVTDCTAERIQVDFQHRQDARAGRRRRRSSSKPTR